MKNFIILFLIGLFIIFAAESSNAQIGWLQQNPPKMKGDLITVYFTSSNNGFIAGDDGYLAATRDGGRSWNQFQLDLTDNITEIFFRNEDNGYLVAGRKMFRTKDGGRSWLEFVPLKSRDFGGIPDFLSVRFTSKNDGFISGSILKNNGKDYDVIDSLILRTNDGGETWSRIIVPFKKEIYNLDFVGDDRGWIVGDDGVILATRDAGVTWQMQKTFLRNAPGKTVRPALYSVDFRDKNEGYVVGGYGTILRTENGGETWQVVKTSYNETLYRIDFTNDENGWITGKKGTILRSSDKGRSWLKQESKTSEDLYGLFMTKKYGWAVGEKGMILKYDR